MKIYNDYEERLYSTGDEYLDDLLEKAFCDGYYYAQKEYIGANDILAQMGQRGISKHRAYIELKQNARNLKTKGLDPLKYRAASTNAEKSLYKAKSLKKGSSIGDKWSYSNYNPKFD